MRAIPYQLKPDGEPNENNSAKKILVDRLVEAQKDRMKDSPIFQMVEGFPDIQHIKTDVFRKRVHTPKSIEENYKRQENKESRHFVI